MPGQGYLPQGLAHVPHHTAQVTFGNTGFHGDDAFLVLPLNIDFARRLDEGDHTGEGNLLAPGGGDMDIA